MPETDACGLVDDILATIPQGADTIVGGDFNTRLGNGAPCIDGVRNERACVDMHVCTRAPWMLQLCELHGLHVLNGAQPGDPAPFTCSRQQGHSSVDYILSR